MANKNRNNRNSWDDRDSDYRDNDRNRNWNRDSGQNTSMHQNEKEGGRPHEQNYGLGDTSQGSENYGHVDTGHGARFYGTGNYGGYFGGGNEDDNDDSRHQDRRGNEGRNETFGDKNLNQGRRGNNSNEGRSYNSGNYERGPRYGNSSIHGKSYGSENIGRQPGYRGGSGQNSDFGNYGQSRNGGRDSVYDNGRNSDWSRDRDWWDKTTDEVSSWFGDEGANRRREMDEQYGEHQGKGPKGYTRSDDKIKDDVEERLYQDSFIDASDIEVSVSDGEVTLSGTVDHKQTKRRAEDCADAVSGVKDVSNHLKVNRPSAYGSSTGTGSSSENVSLTSANTGTLGDSAQKLDQSKDLTGSKNK